MALYLDYNATTPVDPAVLEVMTSIYQNVFGNAGSRTHIYGRSAEKAVETSREIISEYLNVKKTDVVFTSGASESDNIAILGLSQWAKSEHRPHFITTTIEHKAVLEPFQHLQQLGFDVDFAPVDSTGRVNPETITDLLRPDTALVSVMHVNNETGVIQPIEEIGSALATTKTFFHVDAAQGFGKDPRLQHVEYDLLSISGHKIYGPQGIGALIVRSSKKGRAPLQPLMYGGGQERGLRPGTLPVALIAGLGKAVELALELFQARIDHATRLKQSVLDQLQSVQFHVNGSQENSIPSCINVSFPGVDSEALMLAITDDLAISNGSACTSSSYTPSHVLSAMGLPDSILSSAVRISWGPQVDRINLDPLITYVKDWQ